MGKTAKAKQQGKERYKGHANKTQAKGGREKVLPRSTTVSKKEPIPPRQSQPPKVLTRLVQAPALGPSLPPLVITYTNDQSVIADWLQEHVLGNDLMCLGLDTETKPTFTREASMAKRGPDVLQLATAEGKCLVIHLSQMEGLNELRSAFGARDVVELLERRGNADLKRLGGYIQLCSVLRNPNIAKAGVGIDQDALEMHENRTLSMNCRLELRTIKVTQTDNSTAVSEAKDGQDPKTDNNLPQGLKGITEYYVPGITVPKKKKLQMSNWAATRLSDDQVGYAAADAFAAAITVEALVNTPNNPHTLGSFIRTVLIDEIDIAHLRQDRERSRKERKKERDTKKRIAKEKKMSDKETKSQKKSPGAPQNRGNEQRGVR